MHRISSTRLILAAVLAGVFLLAGAAAALARPRAQSADLPAEGWSVCLVSGIESIPGVPDLRQVFELCHADGWRLRAYCLDPGVTAPQVGASCSRVEDEVFWCGQGVQNLGFYGVLQTPASTQTVTVTATATSTLTPTRTLTPAQAELTQTPGEASATATYIYYPDYGRPLPGGMGSLGPFLAGLGLVLAAAGGLAWRLLHRRA